MDLKSNLYLALENQAEVSIAKATNIVSGCSPPHMSKQRKGLPNSDTTLTLTYIAIKKKYIYFLPQNNKMFCSPAYFS